VKTGPQIDTKLATIIDGCLKGERQYQKQLYELFYGYAMSICLRYSQRHEHAVEIANDGFLKVFTKLDMYNPNRSFKAWLRRIMINTSVDHYRKEVKHVANHQDIEQHTQISNNETVLDQMAFDQVLSQIQLLSPSYRTVFNLYVIDGYKHEEIATMLGISVGTSKSNLSRARIQLQNALKKIYRDELA
jgi:RNA polymerase sigma-70 factor (ECF subfamily)